MERTLARFSLRIINTLSMVVDLKEKTEALDEEAHRKEG